MKKKSLLLTAVATLGLTAATMAQNVPSYVPTNGLVGWWPFNGNANDESGNGNNGAVNGSSLTIDRFGNQNKAYNFNGSSNYIDVGTLPTLGNNPSALTQNAWVLAATDQSNYCKMPLISKRHSGNNSWATLGAGGNGTIGVPWNNQAYFFVNGPNYSAGITNALYSNNVTNDGQWHMLTGTKNGSTYKLYFDGILQDSIIDNYSVGSNDNMIFGHESIWGFSCEQWYAGKLDDIGIWSRALTQQEVTTLYNGCQLSINSQPTNQTININSNAQFTVGSSDPSATYQWQTDLGVGFQNLNSVGQYSGTTTNTLTVSNVTMSNNNQPFRCIINSGSCSDTSNVAVLTVNNNVGINETNQGNLFSVFPNPAQSIINVKTDSKLLGSVYSIFDNNGRIVQTGKINSENTTIELGNLSSGIYMFSVGENMKQNFRLIKE
jgi:hypothetical protein